MPEEHPNAIDVIAKSVFMQTIYFFRLCVELMHEIDAVSDEDRLRFIRIAKTAASTQVYATADQGSSYEQEMLELLVEALNELGVDKERYITALFQWMAQNIGGADAGSA